jgi:hypothetical protein
MASTRPALIMEKTINMDGLDGQDKKTGREISDLKFQI